MPADEVEKIKREYKKHSDWRENEGPNGQPGGQGNATVVIRVGIERIYLTRLRASAAIALGRIDHPLSRKVLLGALALRDDRYSDLYKGFAIMSLARIGNEEVLPVLLEYLAPKYRDGKRKTLREVESPLRGFAALALGLYARPQDTPQGPSDRAQYDKVCEVLAERIADLDETLEVRSACAMGLGLTRRTECLRLVQVARMNARADEELLIGYTMLGSALLGDRNIIEPAKRFLDAGRNKNEDTSGLLGRRAGVLALGLLNTPETIPILVDAWHLDYHVNREVVVAFALCEAYNVTEPLAKLLTDSRNPLEQAFAARCLGEMFSAERPHRLAWFLNGSNYTMKNLRMMPYQVLANEFLYMYLIPCFGAQWQ